MNLGKLIIVGCIKNSEPYMSLINVNLKQIETLFSEVSYIFIENDSVDNTKKILNQWKSEKKNFEYFSLDGLDSYEKSRTIRLEITRNAYIHKIKSQAKYHNYDYMMVVDMDDVFTLPIDLIEFENAVKFLSEKESHAAVFANQEKNYYDLWALRHPSYCSKDFWHSVLQNAISGMSDMDAFNLEFDKIPKFFPKNDPPILVSSAFGGLGIYKLNYVLANQLSYLGHDYFYFGDNSLNFTKLQTCEHVNFNRGIRVQGGELFIYTTLINVCEEIKTNPSAYRGIIIK